MLQLLTIVVIDILLLSLAGLYLLHLEKAYQRVPESIQKISPHRWTEEEIREAYEKEREHPSDIRPFLPPKEGRRYVIVGGSGE